MWEILEKTIMKKQEKPMDQYQLNNPRIHLTKDEQLPFMETDNKITINGNSFSFDPKDTILDVARRNGIEIPTLCHLKTASPTGICGICVVEINDREDLVPACSTPAAAGMVIHSESLKVIKARKTAVSRMLASGNHNCAIRDIDNNDWVDFQLKAIKEEGADRLCPAWGNCELQDLAFRYQAKAENMPPAETIFPKENMNPFIIRDFSRCILCGRCVQACREIQVNNAIDFGIIGNNKKIVAGADVVLKDSDCVFCGECVQVCPVGALVEKNTAAMHWESKITRTTCSYCGVGCQMNLHTKDNTVVKVTGVEDTLPNGGSLCLKGRFGFDFINSKKRLTDP